MKSTTFLQSNHAKIIWRNIAVAVFAVCFALLGLCVTIIPSGAADEVSYTVGEIYGQHANVQHLYDLITGKENATYADVAAAANTVTNAATMREYNNGNDIKVTFGGQEWYAVYLSETMDGKPILTLWLAEAFITAQWNTFFLSHSYNTYPSDMYGTSYVRTKILNNAGSYSTDDGKTLNNAVIPDTNHAMAKFTVERVIGSVTDVIVKPSSVLWQKSGQGLIGTERAKNENWGVPETSDNWSTYFDTPDQPDNYSNNYSAIAGYGDWKDDYLWLPSVTELLRWKNVINLSYSGSPYQTYWTRTGSTRYHGFAGTYASYDAKNFVNIEREIRPALHLDLSATALLADWKEEPADVTVAYNATNQAIEQMTNQPSWYNNAMTITYSKDGVPVTEVKDAGVYTATVKLNDMTKDITLTVTPQAVTVSGITANNKTYDRTQTVTFDTSSVEYTGRYNIDQLSVICSGKFADKNVGVDKPVLTTVTLTGAAAHNYVLTNPELALTADITPQTVVVSGVTVNTKEYDNTTRANLNTQNINFTGKLAGDDLTVAVSGEYAQKTVGNNIAVTLTYDLDGADQDNYLVGGKTIYQATGNITPRLITVTANDQTVKVGDALKLSARVTSGSLASGDTADMVYELLLDLPTDPDADDTADTINPDHLPVGEYTIKGNKINDNYDFTFVDGKYTVLTAEAWDALQTKDDEEPKDNNFWLVIVIVIAVAAFIGALVGIGLVVRSHDKNRDPKPAKEKKVKKDKKNKQDQQPAQNADVAPNKK